MKRETYTTFDIARLLEVYPTTVANWIDDGKLKAFATPGKHRRVKKEDLKNFLTKHKMPLPPELSTRTSKKKKILIVDDDPNIMKSIAAVLKKKSSSLEIYTATDGFEAGQAIIEVKPDLMILDIRLPGIDGIKVCRATRRHNQKIIIIAITGYYTEKNKEKILSAGADSLFKKPIDMDQLYKYMADQFNKHGRD